MQMKVHLKLRFII